MEALVSFEYHPTAGGYCVILLKTDCKKVLHSSARVVGGTLKAALNVMIIRETCMQ